MANAKQMAMFVGGCAAACIVALSVASDQPARAGSRKGGALQIQSINVASESGVPANAIVEIVFNNEVDPASVTPATLQVRGQNSTQTGYTKQVFGATQVVGNIVRFYPRLPTHLRDDTGDFYPAGSALDDAAANAGFKPVTGYQVLAIGKPAIATIRGTNGRPLKISTYTRFKTAAASPPEKLWTTQTYSDSPPPQFSFSNPPDTVPSAATNYGTHGGTQDVPNSAELSLYCTKVPLAPGTARNQGNVELTMFARKGDYTLRRPVIGTVFVEQSFETTLLAFQPRVSLADLGTYGLRVSKGVKDLTEQNDFSVNRDRARLHEIYDWLAQGRLNLPGTPYADLPDPKPELILDWPKEKDSSGNFTAETVMQRGVLKTNMLQLGDLYPDEIDPRVMLIFTTRDEPVTRDTVVVEMTKSENLYDSGLSTGEIDTSVPGAASGSFTAAGGSGALGDYFPTSSKSIAADSFPNAELNYRNVSIPNGVVITFTGTKPPTIKALSIVINGELNVNGFTGQGASTSVSYSSTFSSTYSTIGSPGGPGGGKGGNGATVLGSTGQSPVVAGSGTPGNDGAGVVASAQDGGRGGVGGAQGTGSAYVMGAGGGGGGGIRTGGTSGAASTPPYVSWAGSPGAGGAAALGNDDLVPLVGGAGGGAGATGGYIYPSYNWGQSGGSGGGGGGALILQTAGTLTIGTTGAIRAHGGLGGAGSGIKSTWSSGPGGGGGGGSILLRSTKGFNISNPAGSLDVGGGAGGTQSGTYTSPYGGNGGSGLVRTEDPNGGIAIPGATQGLFQPVGAGVPSFVYTKWIDLGVQDPRVLPWTVGDIVTSAQNDAIYVQAQMTREHPVIFGTPDTSTIITVPTSNIADAQQSSNTAVASMWVPIKLHDETGIVGGAFGNTIGQIPGLPPNPPKEYAGFNISALNGKGYRFIRFRVFFQLDATQSTSSPLPNVDRIITTFEFNF